MASYCLDASHLLRLLRPWQKGKARPATYEISQSVCAANADFERLMLYLAIKDARKNLAHNFPV